MGQTLTHGVYLPDEGERNCYSGLAANWQLLDGSVGTVASHTTQIAGKAPLVHTHTKADITDFPAYGTTAGTICEGNDSRLSDARTPVAHTHTKSDVTDLLNSNFIPSANNSYDLGSASKQWLNTYSKGYYYNGVAWGLDKANEWSGENSFNNANLNRKYNFTFGDNSYRISRIQYQDKNSTRWGVLAFVQNTDNSVYCDIGVNCLKNDGQTVLSKSIRFLIQPDNTSEFKPINDKAIDLGTSTFRWKTLNGINPGALSLPNLTKDTYDPTNGWYDLDTTDWDLTGSPIDISSSILKDGYVYVCLACDSTGYVVICEGVFTYPNCYFSTSGLPVSGYARALLPVRKGTDVRLYLKGTSIHSARLFPALGNV